MFIYQNSYILNTLETEGVPKYYVSFNDGQGVFNEIEVSHSIYLEFCQFVKDERNLKRWDERHIEHLELADEDMYSRAIRKPKNLDEIVFENFLYEHLEKAIENLSDIQSRRFDLYYNLGLTYEQIGNMEGCSKMSVKRSIDRAEEKIREKLKKFKN
ncbi:MAG: sigma-70 family RNA polymerase sigma factor [Defluviitaleaceae bacterium]|nr:sigma-70 family RNA polymerase sigma factor [Defluviitaleaceae bacterium]